MICLIPSNDLFHHPPSPPIPSQDVVIQEKDYIRLRIVGTRVDANDIVGFVFTSSVAIVILLPSLSLSLSNSFPLSLLWEPYWMTTLVGAHVQTQLRGLQSVLSHPYSLCPLLIPSLSLSLLSSLRLCHCLTPTHKTLGNNSCIFMIKNIAGTIHSVHPDDLV